MSRSLVKARAGTASAKALPCKSGLYTKALLTEGKLDLTTASETHERAVAQALGSEVAPFQNFVMSQLVQILPKTNSDMSNEVNAIIAMLTGIAPRDELEAMLAAQMIAGHLLSMETARRARHTTGLIEYQAHSAISTKFARTFAAQLETLSRHRRGGKQIVEHVHLAAGSQAVFAQTVTTGGGGE